MSALEVLGLSPINVWALSDWFEEPFFQEKYLLYLYK